jgi:hypothetical protein
MRIVANVRLHKLLGPDVACMSPGGRNCSPHFRSLLCVVKAPYNDITLGRLANVFRLSFDRI